MKPYISPEPTEQLQPPAVVSETTLLLTALTHSTRRGLAGERDNLIKYDGSRSLFSSVTNLIYTRYPYYVGRDGERKEDKR